MFFDSSGGRARSGRDPIEVFRAFLAILARRAGRKRRASPAPHLREVA